MTKKTFIRKSLNYLPFIIMIAKCQTPKPLHKRKSFYKVKIFRKKFGDWEKKATFAFESILNNSNLEIYNS